MGTAIREFIYQFLEIVKPYDIWLFKKINQEWTVKWADAFMPVITDLHKTSWFFIALPIVILLILGKKYKINAIAILIGLFLCLGVNDWAGGKVKRSIPRARPFQSMAVTAAVQKSPAADNTSFYSNHAANNFALAVYMAFFYAGAIVAVFSDRIINCLFPNIHRRSLSKRCYYWRTDGNSVGTSL